MTRSAWAAADGVDAPENMRRFVCDNFTIADIPIGPLAYRWYELPIEREDFTHLQRWYDAICARPAFQKHCMTGLS